MEAVIDNQRISKRRKTSPSNKSAGFDSGFMSLFIQKPVLSKKKKSGSSFASYKKEQEKRRKNQDKKKTGRHEHPAGFPEARKPSGFSFPIPSLATIAVIAGTVVIALAAFNWEDFNIKSPDIYAFKPVEDADDAEKQIIKYAETGVPGIYGNKPNEVKTTMETAAVTGENTSETNHHGMLVTFEWQEYMVKRGDSVSGIAQAHDVSVGAVIAANNIRNARTLREGTVLKIPNIDGIPYQIQRGDSLLKISTSFNVPLEVILDVNDIKSDNIRIGETLFIPGARMNDIDLRMSLGELFMFPLPTRRYVTSYFGMRKDPKNGALQFHDGVDFRADTGTTVMASLDGKVSVVGESWLYGKYIIISHSNGYKTLYGHLNSFSVRQGDNVARGRKIGESGNTGYSTGPHLHFGMYNKNNKLVNPLELLN